MWRRNESKLLWAPAGSLPRVWFGLWEMQVVIRTHRKCFKGRVQFQHCCSTCKFCLGSLGCRIYSPERMRHLYRLTLLYKYSNNDRDTKIALWPKWSSPFRMPFQKVFEFFSVWSLSSQWACPETHGVWGSPNLELRCSPDKLFAMPALNHWSLSEAKSALEGSATYTALKMSRLLKLIFPLGSNIEHPFRWK